MIQPEFTLPSFSIRPVTLETVVGQDGANVAVVEDLGFVLCGSGNRARDDQEQQERVLR